MRRRPAIAAVAILLLVLSGCSADRRPRVLLLGDSLMAEASVAAQKDLRAHGFRTHAKALPGTGFLDTGTDWSRLIRVQVRRFHPDVVVALFSGNYNEPKPGIPWESDAFYAAWRDASIRNQKLMTADGAVQYWVTILPQRPPPRETVGRRLNQMYAELGRTIDGRSALAGPGDSYAESLPGPDGKMAVVRQADGIHLTDAGALLLGARISAGVRQGPHPKHHR